MQSLSLVQIMRSRSLSRPSTRMASTTTVTGTAVRSHGLGVAQPQGTLPTATTIMPTNKFDILLFLETMSSMYNNDIVQESSCLAAGNHGAKGSMELQKNCACATKGKTKKFMTIQGQAA